MTSPTRLVCRPWAGIPDLPEDRPIELEDDRWDSLLWQASEILYAFSGRQYNGGGCQSTVVLDAPPGRSGERCPRWRPVGEQLAAAAVVAEPRPARWARDQVVVHLPGPPITSVDEVIVGSDPVAYGAALPAGRVWLTDGRRWPLDGTAAVTYTHGIPPPDGGQNAAVLLALELAKAHDGQDCRLPDRVSTVTREGVTVGLMDTFDNLEKLQTGIFEVDLWLKSVNPHRMTRRASAWSPDRAQTRRITR